MSSIDEVKLHLATALAGTEQAALGISGVVDRLDEAIALLRVVTVGSVHPKVDETINRLEQAKALLRQGHALVRGGIDSAQEYSRTI